MGRLTLVLLIVAFPSACLCQTVHNETFSVSTYFPSPHGVYKNIRLYPTTEPPVGHPARVPGSMFFNDTDQKLYVFNGNTNTFEQVGNGGGGTTYWLVNGNVISNTNAGFVGIGTTVPAYKLDVNGTIWVTGDICIPSGQCVSKIP